MTDQSKNNLEISSIPDYRLSGRFPLKGLSVLNVIIIFFGVMFILFANNQLNLTSFIFIIPIFLLLFFICFIFIFIDTQIDQPTEKIIINDTDIIISNRLALNKWSQKTYPLRSIANYSFQVNTNDENRQGLIRPSTKLGYISIFLDPFLWDRLNSKGQRLVLTDVDNKIIREINLSYYYEQDIKKLLTFLQERSGIHNA
jgi:hypothetical protein